MYLNNKYFKKKSLSNTHATQTKKKTLTQVKLADFGVALKLPRDKGNSTDTSGSGSNGSSNATAVVGGGKEENGTAAPAPAPAAIAAAVGGKEKGNVDVDVVGSPYWMAPEIIEMNGKAPKNKYVLFIYIYLFILFLFLIHLIHHNTPQNPISLP
jgi:serine/threonine protein kinase